MVSRGFCTPFPRAGGAPKHQRALFCAHRLHIKRTVKHDQIFWGEKPASSASPPNRQKTPYAAKPFVLRRFEAFLSAIFLHSSKNTRPGCEHLDFHVLVLDISAPPRPKKKTHKHLFLQCFSSKSTIPAERFFLLIWTPVFLLFFFLLLSLFLSFVAVLLLLFMLLLLFVLLLLSWFLSCCCWCWCYSSCCCSSCCCSSCCSRKPQNLAKST